MSEEENETNTVPVKDSSDKTTTKRMLAVAFGSIACTLLSFGMFNAVMDVVERHEKVSHAKEQQKQQNAARDFVAPLSDEGMVTNNLARTTADESIGNAPDVEVKMKDNTPGLSSCRTLTWTVPAESTHGTAQVITDVDSEGNFSTSTGIYRKKIEEVYAYILSHPELKPKVSDGCLSDYRAPGHKAYEKDMDGWLAYSDGTWIKDVDLDASRQSRYGISFKSKGIQSPPCMEVPSGNVCNLSEQTEPYWIESQVNREITISPEVEESIKELSVIQFPWEQ
jgi:hypothetical protein